MVVELVVVCPGAVVPVVLVVELVDVVLDVVVLCVTVVLDVELVLRRGCCALRKRSTCCCT